MRDVLVLAALLLSFAALVTTHLAIAVRLLWRVRPWYRGLVAALVPPLAPIWAWRQQWRRMCYLWIGAVVVYALARVLAAF